MSVAIVLPIESRQPIYLDELQATASFLVRKDRKYIVPAASLATLLAEIDTGARVLEINGQRSFNYESLYFDTDDLQSYFRALRQRPDRFKVRVRVYTNSGLAFLEAKTRDHHGRTVKERRDRRGCSAPSLSEVEHRWLEAFAEIDHAARNLSHIVTTTYTRSTLVLPLGEGRVTIDSDLAFSRPDGTTVATPDIVILESKGSGHPTSVDRMLWEHRIRPVSISKYGCGLSLLADELPANRWHRVRTQLAAAIAP